MTDNGPNHQSDHGIDWLTAESHDDVELLSLLIAKETAGTVLANPDVNSIVKYEARDVMRDANQRVQMRLGQLGVNAVEAVYVTDASDIENERSIVAQNVAKSKPRASH